MNDLSVTKLGLGNELGANPAFTRRKHMAEKGDFSPREEPHVNPATGISPRRLADALRRIQDPSCPKEEADELFVHVILPIVESVSNELKSRFGLRSRRARGSFYAQLADENPGARVWLRFMSARECRQLAFDLSKVRSIHDLERAFRHWVREILTNDHKDNYRREKREAKKKRNLLHAHAVRNRHQPSLVLSKQEIVELLKKIIQMWADPANRKNGVDVLAFWVLYVLIRVWELDGKVIGKKVQTQLRSEFPWLDSRRIAPDIAPLGVLLDALENYVNSCAPTSCSQKNIFEYLSQHCCQGRLNSERCRQWLCRARKQFMEQCYERLDEQERELLRPYISPRRR